MRRCTLRQLYGDMYCSVSSTIALLMTRVWSEQKGCNALTVDGSVQGIGQGPSGIIAILGVLQEGEVQWGLAKKSLFVS